AQRELLAGPADIERHLRLPLPAGALALEEMSEKPLLQAGAIARIEVREVRIAVHLQPFLPGAGSEPAFEIAARVQPLAAPVRRRQDRHVDLAEIGDAGAV